VRWSNASLCSRTTKRSPPNSRQSSTSPSHRGGTPPRSETEPGIAPPRCLLIITPAPPTRSWDKRRSKALALARPSNQLEARRAIVLGRFRGALSPSGPISVDRASACASPGSPASTLRRGSTGLNGTSMVRSCRSPMRPVRRQFAPYWGRERPQELQGAPSKGGGSEHVRTRALGS